MIPCHGHEPQQKNPKPTTATQRKPPWQVNPLNKIGKKRGTKRAYPLRVLSSKSSCHPNFLWKREREREKAVIKSGRHSAQRTTRQSELSVDLGNSFTSAQIQLGSSTFGDSKVPTSFVRTHTHNWRPLEVDCEVDRVWEAWVSQVRGKARRSCRRGNGPWHVLCQLDIFPGPSHGVSQRGHDSSRPLGTCSQNLPSHVEAPFTYLSSFPSIFFLFCRGHHTLLIIPLSVCYYSELHNSMLIK